LLPLVKDESSELALAGGAGGGVDIVGTICGRKKEDLKQKMVYDGGSLDLDPN